MRVTAICMILLLASQAGAAIVCPAECAPAAMPAPISATMSKVMHHGHEHHMLGTAPSSQASAAQCGKVMVAESALANASRVPEFALDVPAVIEVKASALIVVNAISFGAPALKGSSPPHFSVLRI